MKPTGSRRKGQKGEAEAARLLAQWFYDDPRALVRTHASRSKKGFVDQVGDVAPARSELPHPWIFSVEVKWHGPRKKKGRVLHEPWMIEDALFSKQATILQFWKQCREAATLARKIPLLLLKKNRRPWIAGVRTVDFCFLDKRCSRALRIPRYGLELVPLPFLLAKTSPAAWLALWRTRYEPASSTRPRRATAGR